MAAPTAGVVRYPADLGNTGKRTQLQQEVVGSDVAHAPYVITRSQRNALGSYRFATGVQSVQASAHDGVNTAFFWLQNLTESDREFNSRARLRRLQVALVAGATESAFSAVRVGLYRFTFTGTASGATVAAAKCHTGSKDPVTTVRTAVTGMVVTVGTQVWTVAVPDLRILTAGRIWGGGPIHDLHVAADEEEYFDVASGEGLLLGQIDAGSNPDARRFVVTGCWDEYDFS